jgi:hypothetical protein
MSAEHDFQSFFPKPKRKKSPLIFFIVVMTAIFLIWGIARGQQKKLSKDTMVVMQSAFCSDMGDAQSLLRVIQDGMDEALLFIKNTDNTCDIAKLPVIIGDVLEEKGKFVLLQIETSHGILYTVILGKFLDRVSI